MATPKFPPGYLEEYNGDSLVVSLSIFIAVMVIAIGLRFWAKSLSKLPFGVDDWLMIPSLIFGVASIACCLAMVAYGGVGYHVAAVEMKNPNELVIYAKLVIAYATFYLMAMTLPKISMLFMFLRIFIEKWQRIACYVLIGILVATSIGDMIANWNLCTPLPYLWDNSIPGGHCFDVTAYWRWGTFPNIVTDVLMMLLPIPTIVRLQLKWKDKIGVLLTFLVGGGGLVASILRFHTFYTIQSVGPGSDPTYDAVPGAIYSGLEVTVYIVCACLPFYRGFYLYVRRNNQAKKTTMAYGTRSATWNTRGGGNVSREDDYQIPLHKGLGNKSHSMFANSDDTSEKSAEGWGISVQTEYQVTTHSR